MDISLLDKTSVKIKFKKVNFIIDPTSKIQKTNADCVLAFDQNNFDTGKLVDYRLVIKGPGEYEVGGVKVVGVKEGDGLYYSLIAGETAVILGKVGNLGKILDKLDEHRVAVLNVDSELNQSIITTIEPKYLILYGEKASQELSSLNKEVVEKKTASSQKININEEKSPEEIELSVLG